MERFAQLGADIVKLWAQCGGDYLSGIQNTIILALVATAIGCVIGFVCGVLNTIPCAKNDPPVKRFFVKLIRVVVRVYVEVFRGTPMVLQAVFIYYGLPYFSGNAIQWPSVWAAAILVVSVNTGAYMAECVRGGIISIDPGQTEGAKAIGMTHVQTMTQRDPAPGHPEHPAPDRQQLHHQHQGLLGHVHHLLHGVLRRPPGRRGRDLSCTSPPPPSRWPAISP